MKSRRYGLKGPVTSSTLEERLKQTIDMKNEIEEDYRENKQRFWCIMFIDVSSSAKGVWDQGEQVADVIFGLYQKQVRAVLKEMNSCFVEPGGGPQVVCCFEKPDEAVIAAKAVINTLAEWNKYQDNNLKLMPSIGIHQGYIVYHDDLIHQSNTNNMAKRIQTEAKTGDILISEDLYDVLKKDSRFRISYLKTANLKNIPEPQKLFKAQVRILVPPVDVDKVDLQIETVVEDKEPVGNEKVTHNWIIVFIDVCESTKKFWSYGDREASQLIQEYQKLCHLTFTQCGAAFVKSCEGDQIFAGFELDYADKSLIASIHILQSLFRRNINLPQTKQVRAAIGMHVGEVCIQNEDLAQTKDMRVGKGIQSQASADEILISDTLQGYIDPQYHNYLEIYGTCEFSGISDPCNVLNLKWIRVPSRLASSPMIKPMRQSSRFSSRR